MAAISITAANVSPVAGSDGLKIDRSRLAGATITAGKALYLDPATDTWRLADCDAASAEVRAVQGIALNGASAGQPLGVQLGGDINIGATVTVNTVYILGATAGDIAPLSDLTTGWYLGVIGVAITTGRLRLSAGPNMLKSGVAS